MNHAELEAIRGRVEQAGQPDTDAEIDRADLLAELDRKWRLLETADAKINDVRRIVTELEDHVWVRDIGVNRAIVMLRKIVGPR